MSDCHCTGTGPCGCHEEGRVAATYTSQTGMPVPFHREPTRGWTSFGPPRAQLDPNRRYVATAPVVGRHMHQVLPGDGGSVHAGAAEPVEGGWLLDVEPMHTGFLAPAGRPR
jgi:hypothetical protein